MTSYVRFVSAVGFTNLADGIATVAWAWLATLLTRDPLLVAIVPVALRLPWFLFAIPAGLVTDRVNRRTLILAMDGARALAFLLATLSIWLALPLGAAPTEGVSNVWLFAAIIAAALLVGLAEVFRDNAAQTMLPAFVPHDRLEGANARMWTVENIANQLIGPVAGAFLVGLFLPSPFLFNAACFGLAAWLVFSIKGNFQPAKRETRNVKAELAEAFTFLRSNPLLSTLAWTTGFWNMFHQMTVVALVLYAQETLGLNATQYGLLLTAGAFGAILGGLVAEPLIRRFGAPVLAPAMLSVSILDFGLLAAIPHAAAAAFALFVGGVSAIVWDTISVSNRQRIIPDAMLGRVNSMYRLMAWGMMPLGLALSGLITRAAEGPLSREVALALPFWVATIGIAVLTALAWRGIRDGLRGLAGSPA
ncbi:MAG: MFS transporter [Rhizobiaceae bacterium]|nr:MFS transporter [Rhizobiaceae bacterium]